VRIVRPLAELGAVNAGSRLTWIRLPTERTVRAHRVEAIAHDRRDVADLGRIPGVFDAEVDGERVTCTVRGSVGPLLAWLSAGDVVELDSRELSLEEVFLSEFAPGTAQ